MEIELVHQSFAKSTRGAAWQGDKFGMAFASYLRKACSGYA